MFPPSFCPKTAWDASISTQDDVVKNKIKSDMNLCPVPSHTNYWVGQNVHSDFSIRCSRNTQTAQMTFLADPIYVSEQTV